MVNLKRVVVMYCLIVSAAQASAQQVWRGLVVEAENRCIPYDKDEQYPYPQSVEDGIVAEIGGQRLRAVHRSVLYIGHVDRH